MWGSFFFSGFWKRGGTRGECYFMKMHGRRCWNSELFFHRLREVNRTYIYFGEGVLCWKNSLFFFLEGFCFSHLWKDFFFAFFFWLSWDHRLFQFRFFFLSSHLPFFTSIFSSTFKRHFLPPFFVLPSFFGILVFRPFPYSSSYRMFLTVFLVYLLVVLIRSFLFIRLIFIIYFSFPIFCNSSQYIFFILWSFCWVCKMQGRNSKEQVQNEEQGTNPEAMCQFSTHRYAQH